MPPKVLKTPRKNNLKGEKMDLSDSVVTLVFKHGISIEDYEELKEELKKKYGDKISFWNYIEE